LVPADVASELVSATRPSPGKEPEGARESLGKQIEIVRTSAGDLIATHDTVLVPTLDWHLNEDLGGA
jgi:hypothetical protein